MNAVQYASFEPRGAGRALMTDRSPRLFVSGPAGTGKSRSCIEKVHALLMAVGGARALFVRDTLASMRTTLLVTYEDEVLGETTAGKIIKGRQTRETRMVYNYPNGSEIDLFGLYDVNRSLSGQYDIIYIQQVEEAQFGDVQKLTTRLRNGRLPYQQLLCDCNPGPPTHWIMEQTLGKDGKDPWLKLLYSHHEENPRLFDQETGEITVEGRAYMAVLDALQGHEHARLRLGLWVAAEGSRFLMDARIHQFRKAEKWPNGMPVGATIIGGLDYGKRAPYCFLWIYIDSDRNAWVFREHYQAGLTSTQQAQEIIQRTPLNEKVSYIYADPSIWAELTDHAKGTKNPSIAESYESELAGVDRIGPLLRGYNKSQAIYLNTLDTMLERGNGIANVYIEEGCIDTWKELTGALYWDPKSGQPKEEIDPRCPNHAITALCYALHTYYQGPKDEAPMPTPEESRNLHHQELLKNERERFARSHGGRQRIRV